MRQVHTCVAIPALDHVHANAAVLGVLQAGRGACTSSNRPTPITQAGMYQQNTRIILIARLPSSGDNNTFVKPCVPLP